MKHKNCGGYIMIENDRRTRLCWLKCALCGMIWS